MASRLAAWPDIGFCHPDLRIPIHPQLLDDPLLSASWHLDNTGQSGGLPGRDVGAFDAWDTTRGEGQLIAVLDTGVDLSHPDLAVAPGYDFGSDDDDPGPDLATADYPHGTAMAGLAAATGDNGLGMAGVAPAASVLPVKVVGGMLSYSQLYAAITYSVDRGASVLLNAWGYADVDCAPFELPPVLQEALDYAEREGRGGLGSVVVFSVGNGGCDVSANGLLSDPRVVVVGAVDDRGERVSYSSFGAPLDLMAPSGGDGRPGLQTTDIVGVLGYNNDVDGDYWVGASGTSAATAVASGVFALMFAADPLLTAGEARAIACATATRDEAVTWDAEGRSVTHGCGRLNAARAVASVREAALRREHGGCAVDGRGTSAPAPCGSLALLATLAAGWFRRASRGRRAPPPRQKPSVSG